MKDNTNMLYFPVGQSANILVGQKQEESYKMTLPNQALHYTTVISMYAIKYSVLDLQ